MPAHLKDPALRQRANKASTAALLPAKTSVTAPPPLTKQILGLKAAVKPQVQRWWRTIWSSPMASRWLAVDVEGLYMIAQLRQLLAEKPIASLAAEIRHQEARYGLDVLSRRRLDWRIEGPAALQDQAVAPANAAPADDVVDPRTLLRAVK